MSRIYFAGAEKEANFYALLENGAQNVLMSFFYLLKRMNEWPRIVKMMAKYKDRGFFLDSGAFTYMQRFHRGDHEKLTPPEQYFESYVEFVTRYGHLFDFCCEFDIDTHWSEFDLSKKREVLLAVCPNLLVCWHLARGKDAWMKYLEDPRIKHLGVGSSGGTKDIGLISRLVNLANAKGKTVHGFAQTKLQTTFKWVAYFSVDSASWMSGERYGDMFVFRNNEWIQIPGTQKADRKKYHSYFKNIGCNPSLIYKDDLTEVKKANIIAWSRMAMRLEMIHKPRLSKQIIDRETKIVTEPQSTEGREIGMEQLKQKLRRSQTGKLILKKNIFKDVDVSQMADHSKKKTLNLAPKTKPLKAAKNTSKIIDLLTPPTPAAKERALERDEDSFSHELESARPPSFPTPTERPARSFQATLPKFTCSTCVMAGECPEYKEGYVCAYTKQFASFGTRNVEDIQDTMRAVFQQNTIRLQRAYMMEEQITGGQIDHHVTNLSNTVMEQAKELQEMEYQSGSVSINAKGKKGLGVLAQLFNRPKDIREHEDEVIDVSSESTELKAQEEKDQKEMSETQIVSGQGDTKT